MGSATTADVQAQQRAISSEQVNLSAAVNAHRDALPASTLEAWYALARQCAAFVKQQVYTFGDHTPDVMYPQGAELLSQLAAWRGSLAALGVTVPDTQWNVAPEAPPPQGTPNPLFGMLGELADAVPIVIVLLLVREWNATRR